MTGRLIGIEPSLLESRCIWNVEINLTASERLIDRHARDRNGKADHIADVARCGGQHIADNVLLAGIENGDGGNCAA